MSQNTINIFNEKWSPIKGYENLYLVSNYGRVLSLLRPAKKKNRNYGGRILRQHKTINGYPQVGLAKDNKSQTKLIHRLVCDAFKNNTYNKPCVNHIDLDKTNNHLSNLEWCTYSENEKHSYANGKIPIKSNLGNTGLKAKDSKQVVQFDLLNNVIGVYESASLAAKETGFNQGHISSSCRGEINVYKKSKWIYIELSDMWQYVIQKTIRKDDDYVMKSEYSRINKIPISSLTRKIDRDEIDDVIKLGTRTYIKK